MHVLMDVKAVVNDPQRLEALRLSGLLDSEIEEQFDRLTRLASKLLNAPATFFSLVDEDRDFYKSCFGFPEPLASGRELTGVTFCHYSIVSDGALVIPDTRADPVYRQVPTVESLGVAAYLGVPVSGPDGEVLGSFCAIDFSPKDWSPLEVEIMKEFAKSAEREVAIRHWMRGQSRVMEREFAARAELERVMESRARLIRGFTHDVKNPLGAADGFLSLLEDGIIGPVSDKQKASIVRARRSIGTALELIDELVEIARAEAGHLEMERSPVDLRELTREMAEEYRAQAEAKGLRISADVPETIPTINSDPSRIRQVLSNLISNAVKYTPEGQVLVTAATRSDGTAPASGEWVVINVVDTGPGIPDDQLHLLFEEFTRLRPDSARGTGLGLSIGKRLAEALGGRITVRSELAKGSTFTLWLPCARRNGGKDQVS